MTKSELSKDLLLLNVERFRLSPNRHEQGDASNTSSHTADYISRFLKAGIILDRIQYNFYGHSTTQLKSRSCFLLAGSKEEIARRIESAGDFSSITNVEKKVKRIGLLFSNAQVLCNIDPATCEDIEDIQNDGYNFTDGCGFISEKFGKDLARRYNMLYRNKRYLPSVFQIRYRGYKGVLSLQRSMEGKVVMQFRESMKKFNNGQDMSFSTIEHSKVSVTVGRSSNSLLYGTEVALTELLAILLRISQ